MAYKLVVRIGNMHKDFRYGLLDGLHSVSPFRITTHYLHIIMNLSVNLQMVGNLAKTVISLLLKLFINAIYVL